ncbi:hypothetical protein ABG067_004833 [Albugo candida]
MEMALKTQELLHERGAIEPEMKLSQRHQNLAASVGQSLEEDCNVSYYLQDLLKTVDVPELAYQFKSTTYDRHIKALVITLLPACQPPTQRICKALATFLLAQLLQIIEYAPLINVTCILYVRLLSILVWSFLQTLQLDISDSVRISLTNHTSEECTKSLGYFDTRLEYGEWLVEEIAGLGMSRRNCIWASILKRVTSSDQLLSYNAMLLLWQKLVNSFICCDYESSNSGQLAWKEVSSESIMSDSVNRSPEEQCTYL